MIQLERFRAVAAAVPAKRYSLANSAGICLGRDYIAGMTDRYALEEYGRIFHREIEL